MASKKKSVDDSALLRVEGTALPPTVPPNDYTLHRNAMSDEISIIIGSFENKNKIINDERKEVEFSGEIKKAFIQFFYDGEDIFAGLLHRIDETGLFLTNVRNALKPAKLFLTWLNYAGIPVSTAYNYIKLHQRYQEDLSRYSLIGVKKLLTVARLEDCKTYMNDNVEEIALKPASEVVRQVNERLKKSEKKRRGGRKPKHEDFGNYRMRWSGDGTKIVVENLTKDAQEKIREAIRSLLSQMKE